MNTPGGSPLPMMRGGEVLPQHQPGPQDITGPGVLSGDAAHSAHRRIGKKCVLFCLI